MKTLLAERKSPALTPSPMACLSGAASVNIARGCAHRCVYCYARGYSGYPGDGVVSVYSGLAAKLRAELRRKRRPPRAVYFCSATDPFQPIEEITDATYDSLSLLLDSGVRVGLLTKGVIEPRFFVLFEKFADSIDAQIGVTTADDSLGALIEPCAASPAQRLAQMLRLKEICVHIEARLDPLLPGVTDTEENLRHLFAHLASVGIKTASVNYLFLRSAIRRNLARELPPWMSRLILRHYDGSVRLKIAEGNSAALALPASYRRAAYRRIASLARRFGISVRLCACKNRDILSPCASASASCTGLRRGLSPFLSPMNSIGDKNRARAGGLLSTLYFQIERSERNELSPPYSGQARGCEGDCPRSPTGNAPLGCICRTAPTGRP